MNPPNNESIVTRSKEIEETPNRVRDGYIQLAEKMEQVKNQVAKMERKYDELYQTVKEKNQGRSSELFEKPVEEEPKTERDTVEEQTLMKKDDSLNELATSTQEEPKQPSKKSSKSYMEKMENNPFL